MKPAFGNVAAIKIGSEWHFNKSEVEQWMIESSSKVRNGTVR
jgi:hypothetical protein